MDLRDRSGFKTEFSGGLGPAAHGLRLAPTGTHKAVTDGACPDQEAKILTGEVSGSTVALPGESEPSEALGWLDATTLLVSVGGCGEPVRLVSVDVAPGGQASVLVSGVDVGAPRTVVRNAPTEVPVPKSQEGEAPPGGVG
jgi:hypothetical protein